jgi:hypothetical protein
MDFIFKFLPIIDYIKTRRKLWKQYIVPIFACVITLSCSFIMDIKAGIDIEKVFSDFVNVQISAIAILISFSLAIITILVSADNENIRKLKNEKASEKSYKKLNNAQLSLFQVLLSNISYNVMIEIIYMIILIVYIFLSLIIPTYLIKWLTAISIFFLTHILLVLMECVAQMYLTFWKDKK